MIKKFWIFLFVSFTPLFLMWIFVVGSKMNWDFNSFRIDFFSTFQKLSSNIDFGSWFQEFTKKFQETTTPTLLRAIDRFKVWGNPPDVHDLFSFFGSLGWFFSSLGSTFLGIGEMFVFIGQTLYVLFYELIINLTIHVFKFLSTLFDFFFNPVIVRH